MITGNTSIQDNALHTKTHNPSIVLYCDLDNVILNTDAFKGHIKSKLRELSPKYSEEAYAQLYTLYKKDIRLFCAKVAETFHVKTDEVLSLFFRDDLQPFLMEGARDFLDALTSHDEDIECIIATSGDREFHESKIGRLRDAFPEFADIFSDINVIIDPQKEQAVADALQRSKEAGIRHIILMDDRADVLEKIISLLPEETRPLIHVIRMKFGTYEGQILPETLTPMTTEVSSLKEAYSVIQKIYMQDMEPRGETLPAGMKR